MIRGRGESGLGERCWGGGGGRRGGRWFGGQGFPKLRRRGVGRVEARRGGGRDAWWVIYWGSGIGEAVGVTRMKYGGEERRGGGLKGV